jgi:hypothetical protein
MRRRSLRSHAPCAASVRSLHSPHNGRYANLAPATGAPACAGALKIAAGWPSTAAFQSHELRCSMCHRAPARCACRVCPSARYAPRRRARSPARPAGLPAAARTALLVSASAAPLPIRPKGLPQRQKQRCLVVDRASIGCYRKASEAALHKRLRCSHHLCKMPFIDA